MNQLDLRPLFCISVADVQSVAQWRFGRRLTDDELDQVKDGLEWGLECWDEVVIYAIKDIWSRSQASPDSTP